jgi:hypothetical protein
MEGDATAGPSGKPANLLELQVSCPSAPRAPSESQNPMAAPLCSNNLAHSGGAIRRRPCTRRWRAGGCSISSGPSCGRRCSRSADPTPPTYALPACTPPIRGELGGEGILSGACGLRRGPKGHLLDVRVTPAAGDEGWERPQRAAAAPPRAAHQLPHPGVPPVQPLRVSGDEGGNESRPQTRPCLKPEGGSA